MTLLKPLFLAGCLLSLCYVSEAAQVVSSQVSNTLDSATSISNTVTGNAKDWGVSEEDWQYYQALMKGPAGKWYPQLTPAQVLTIYADNPQDQEHYAELAAKEQHERVERELKFAMAVYHAGLKLYPDEPIMRDGDISAFNPVNTTKGKHPTSALTLQAGDHIALFVDSKTGLDFIALPPLLHLITVHPGISLDIYCVGNVSDNDIQNWAQLNSIPMKLVANGQITLNHDNGKLKAMHVSDTLPYVALIRQGVARTVKVNDLSN